MEYQDTIAVDPQRKSRPASYWNRLSFYGNAPGRWNVPNSVSRRKLLPIGPCRQLDCAISAPKSINSSGHKLPRP